MYWMLQQFAERTLLDSLAAYLLMRNLYQWRYFYITRINADLCSSLTALTIA
jgi:hypothetical protein